MLTIICPQHNSKVGTPDSFGQLERYRVVMMVVTNRIHDRSRNRGFRELQAEFLGRTRVCVVCLAIIPVRNFRTPVPARLELLGLM